MSDGPRWCRPCNAYGDHHSDRHPTEPAALAFTPDAEVEAGVERFRELWPERWEAWLRFCAEDAEETP